MKTKRLYKRKHESIYSSNVVSTKKKNATWRMCVNCHAINNITVKYRHSIYSIDDMSDELHESFIFSKIDSKSGYHQIWMKDGDEWKLSLKINIVCMSS
jgi:hypothetical protein